MSSLRVQPDELERGAALVLRAVAESSGLLWHGVSPAAAVVCGQRYAALDQVTNVAMPSVAAPLEAREAAVRA